MNSYTLNMQELQEKIILVTTTPDYFKYKNYEC